MFYDNFMKLCDQKEKTVTQILSELDLSWTTLMRWKKGTEPHLATKAKVADYFGLAVSDLDDPDCSSDRFTIPIYGKIACGAPSEAVNNIIGREELPRSMAKQGDFFALQASGDSMYPLIFSGDVVIIKKTPDFSDGQVCAVSVGEDATLKKVVCRGDALALIPANPEYPMINYSKAQAEEQNIHILGVAVEIRRKL